MWILTQSDAYQLREWLRLLPFADHPAETLAIVCGLPDAQRNPHLLEEMVGAFADAPSNEAEEVLFKLAEEDPRFYANHRWRDTVLRSGTLSATRRFIDLAAQGVFDLKSTDGWHLARQIGDLIGENSELRARVFGLLKDGPIIDNAPRGEVVEEMVLMALEQEWELCSEGWHAWDLQNAAGLRIQVRQSTATQLWPSSTANERAFKIAPATGYYDAQGSWVELISRNADIFILAWHSETERETLDHLNPDQWQYFVVLEQELPDQKSIRVTVAKKRWKACGYSDLAENVRRVAAAL